MTGARRIEVVETSAGAGAALGRASTKPKTARRGTQAAAAAEKAAEEQKKIGAAPKFIVGLQDIELQEGESAAVGVAYKRKKKYGAQGRAEATALEESAGRRLKSKPIMNLYC